MSFGFQNWFYNPVTKQLKSEDYTHSELLGSKHIEMKNKTALQL